MSESLVISRRAIPALLLVCEEGRDLVLL